MRSSKVQSRLLPELATAAVMHMEMATLQPADGNCGVPKLQVADEAKMPVVGGDVGDDGGEGVRDVEGAHGGVEEYAVLDCDRGSMKQVGNVQVLYVPVRCGVDEILWRW